MQKSPRILIVDDLSSARKVLGRLLSSLGYDNQIMAANGAEALQALEQNSVDLIISDWVMPEMDGIELLKEIRNRGFNLPFLMITSEAKKDRVTAALEAGVTDYICKPLDSKTLGEKVIKHTK